MKITVKELRQLVKEELENSVKVAVNQEVNSEKKEPSQLEIAANEAKRKADAAKKAAEVADRAVKRAASADKADKVLSSVLGKLEKLTSDLAKAGIKSTLGDVKKAIETAKTSLAGEAQESKENPHIDTLKRVVSKSEKNDIKVAPVKNEKSHSVEKPDNILKGDNSINN